jgi:putative transposase
MKTQKNEILSFIENERQQGRTLSEILKNLKVSKTTYYRWLKPREENEPGRKTIRSITEVEKEKIDQKKDKHPELRHRQIQGLLLQEGTVLSPTTVYLHLKSQNKIEPYARREAAWKEARYEVIGANIMWGADWTKLRIGGIRWYLLTLIDFFSRLIVHFEIIPTVNAGHITGLYRSGLEKMNIPLNWHSKPELRVDQGSPNTAKVTRTFFDDIKADLSFARVRRPTDNAKTERFYRTIKQEEIYLVGDYQDIKTANEVIGEYIKWYNEKRPHQSLWNFTPQLVHETNNKQYMTQYLKNLKQKTWERRKEYWMEKRKQLTKIKT